MRFSDVPADHWAAIDIEAAARLGLVQGFDDGSFHPEEAVTRAQEAAIEMRQVRRFFSFWSLASMDLRRQVAPAVVHIINRDTGGLGAGVLLSSMGLLVTAHHVIGGARVATCAFPSWPEAGQGAEAFLRVLWEWPEEDLVLCRASWSGPPMPYLRLADRSPEPGEMVAVIGSPAGTPAWQSLGVIARPPVVAQYYQSSQVLLAVSGFINPGNSGGAIIRAGDGALGGIAVMKLVDVSIEGMAYATPIEAVHQLVRTAQERGLVPAGEVSLP